MDINIKDEGNIKVVSLEGKLDGSTADSLDEAVINKIDEGDKLIVNLKDCNYVSSAGLRKLMIIAKTLKAKDGEAVLAQMTEEVGDVMEMTGFGNIFQAFDNLEDAKKYLNGGG
ncbi:MAG: STAS domain-containing protein [Fusobacteriota bacterium]